MAETNLDAKGKELKDVNSAIKDVISKDQEVHLMNAGESFGLASGLRKGKIVVDGDANDYVGMVNTGAEIAIKGNARNFLGDNMIDGKITVSGNAGYGAGMYCYGGQMFIKGDAGDFTSTMNKGATIIIGGNVGNEVGTYMTAGELIVLGDAGENLGNFIIRGSIYLMGESKSMGNNTKLVPIEDEDVKRFNALFKTEGFEADPSKLKKYIPESDKPFYKAPKAIAEVPACR